MSRVYQPLSWQPRDAWRDTRPSLSHGYASVTLTTFRDVPWNLPFYARLGFAVVPPGQLSDALRTVVDEETRHGLDPRRRVVMKRPGR
jgi:hypothetical protein